ncbi:DUF3575 domain-containing protein [Flammeovirga kamogawensis]|uniref:Outer membrane beta-barrel protein n=1 Tax=Flammeovirga kamogawensis TaxID=373891 RepID=A0ABX8GWJ0_9BACT|nr:DUF3575 domain-containing protein [Flammeovirga kamogawensis]MBB6461206.1 hypothetical protein [Flammeovirga kamogawensis]QWG07769.1 outer membrane beta-barrel protein [Flammeovirga kamogawensis]TRX69575.1 outer membrane beta-barrel protein [Flammeovirga kamogawensis]
MTSTLRRLFTFFFLVILYQSNMVFGQDSLGTAFKKGRALLQLSSSTDAVNYYSGSQNLPLSTGLTGFDLKVDSHFFVRDNFSVGGRLELTRSLTEQLFQNESERFKLGIVFRRYLTKMSNGGIYPEVTLSYGRTYNSANINYQQLIINEEFTGNFFGGGIGVGFTYLVGQHFGIDVGLNYNLYLVDGNTTDLVANVSESTNFTEVKVSFRVGIVILLHKQSN